MTESIISLSKANSSYEPAMFVVRRQSDALRQTPLHCHARGQLLGAENGLLTIDAGDYRWVVPATHAVWIPPDIQHGLRSHGPYSGWSVYIAAASCKQLHNTPCVLEITGLLREAVTRAATWDENSLSAPQKRLEGVILDEIQSLHRTNLGLPMPQDLRLIKIARTLCDNPHDCRRLDEWATWAGISPRTLTRRFSSETGFSFSEWRQRARLLRSLELLAEGKSVTTIALDLGYENVSAFIALFHRVFGTTPGRYKEHNY